MKLRYCLTGIVLFTLKGFSQQIKPLTIGDILQDVQIKTVLNYPALQSNISAFKDKLLILDFMATTCSSCIKALPHFDSLQKIYGDKLQIILVSYEKRERVKKFLANTETGKALQLPIMAEDSIFSNLFPHSYIPHEVWIKDGVVRAITGPPYVKAENIEAVLSGKFINWPVKRDLADYDYSQSIFQNMAPGYYSMLTTNMKDVPGKYLSVADTVNRNVRTAMFNLGIIDLYLRTYGLYTFPQAYTILEVNDKAKYIYDKTRSYRDTWTLANTYCYESVLPFRMNPQSRGEKMRSDIDAWFGLHGRMEKRSIPCNIITKSVGGPLTEGGKTPVSSIVHVLNQRVYGNPFIDETRYTGKYLIEPGLATLTDLASIKIFLHQYGLEIKTETREVDVFVLSETNTTDFLTKKN